MRVLHVNPESGIAGDMFLSMLLSLGLDLDALRSELHKIDLPPWELEVRRVKRASISATSVSVEGGSTRVGITDMRSAVANSELSLELRSEVLAALALLEQAEATVHATERVHLHEIGEVDTVIDLAAAFIGLSLLDVDRVSFGPVSVGSGSIRTAHGSLPNPGPAVAALLAGGHVPMRLRSEEFEFTTPTGATIVRALGAGRRHLSSMQNFRLSRVGYGAGESEPSFSANLLQGLLGEVDEISSGADMVGIFTIACHVDDVTGESLGSLIEILHREGALDAWAAPVVGKKGRPGHELTVLAPAERAAHLVDAVHRLSGSPGVRLTQGLRSVRPVHFSEVVVDGGTVRIKVSDVRAKVEFDDARRVSEATGATIDEVASRALGSYYAQNDTEGGRE